VNKPEMKEGSTPLIIAAKRNQKSLVDLLLKNGADAKHRNNLNLNALDYAVIHGNYEIAFLLKNGNKEIQLKPVDDYIELNLKMKVPCFNIPLFYQSLSDNVELASVPPFNLTNEEKRKFDGKIPDPNETWGNFFKRVLRFELYQPPLVKKDSVPIEQRYTTFVRVQTKLLEMEFDKESKLNILI
jgi:ankyrin repeat protein